jgi:hypothetical protein
MTTTKIEVTTQNINDAINNITEYAKSNKYEFDTKDVSEFDKAIEFDSKSKKKICSNYLTRFGRKITMSQANRFIHFMWRHVLKKEGKAPEMKYSERELDIRAAKKSWKAANDAAEALRITYKEIKGDFYK